MVRKDWRTIGSILSSVGMLVLVGIPRAAQFYPPYIEYFLSEFGTFLLAGFGILTGWFLNSAYQKYRVSTVTDSMSIEDLDGEEQTAEIPTEENSEKSGIKVTGCVEVDEVCWRGDALVNDSDFDWVEFYTSPKCPECQTDLIITGRKNIRNTELRDDIKRNLSTTGLAHLKVWDCSECEFHAVLEGKESVNRAKKLLEKHFQKLATKGREYSIETLQNDLEEDEELEITAEEYWEEYSRRVDSEKVSSNCFY